MDLKDVLDKGLTSMKRKKEDKEPKEPTCCPEPMHDEYPWGLELSLNRECLKKLGKKATDFSVGTKVGLVAHVKVCEVTSRDNDWEDSECVRLKVTELALGDDE